MRQAHDGRTAAGPMTGARKAERPGAGDDLRPLAEMGYDNAMDAMAAEGTT